MIIKDVWIYDELMDLAYETLVQMKTVEKDTSNYLFEFYLDKYNTIIKLIGIIVFENTDDLFKEKENESN